VLLATVEKCFVQFSPGPQQAKHSPPPGPKVHDAFAFKIVGTRIRLDLLEDVIEEAQRFQVSGFKADARKPLLENLGRVVEVERIGLVNDGLRRERLHVLFGQQWHPPNLLKCPDPRRPNPAQTPLCRQICTIIES